MDNQNQEHLYLFMSDEGTPFEEGQNPFPRTPEDDEFDEYIIKKYHLESETEL